MMVVRKQEVRSKEGVDEAPLPRRGEISVAVPHQAQIGGPLCAHMTLSQHLLIMACAERCSAGITFSQYHHFSTVVSEKVIVGQLVQRFAGPQAHSCRSFEACLLLPAISHFTV